MTFSFLAGGIVYRVHSEVGSGPARVIVQEEQPAQEVPMENEGEDE